MRADLFVRPIYESGAMAVDLSLLVGLGKGPLEVHESRRERRGIDPVSNSAELQRIQALPRRINATGEIAAMVTRPNAKMTLRPIQARALSEARASRGLFAPIAVGQGKTLTAALLPTVLELERAVILTNAGLVAQAEHLMREYAEHFYIRRDIRWLSYGILSSPQQFAILDEIKPTLIVADECQALASSNAARTKRFNRYLKDHPETVFCAMSGTITKRSLKDFSHLLSLALKDRTPLPRDWATITEWAEAVDVSDRPRPPGALVELMTPEHAREWLHTHDLDAVRRGMLYLRGAAQRQHDPESEEGAGIQELGRECIRRRMTETPGVVASSRNDLECRLQIEIVPAPDCPLIERALKEVGRKWERPDGELLTFGLEIARVTRHVRLGGFYRWVWPASVSPAQRTEWLAVRAAWRALLRAFLQRQARPGLDSPYLVESALRRGEDIGFDVNSRAAFSEWECMRATIDLPPTEWVWISDAIIDQSVAAIRASKPMIVWADTVSVGEEIARKAQVPWYGAGQEAQRGILAETGNRSIVASIKAHGTGRNLQCFDRALVVGGPSSGAIWEQLLGRLHRPGQQAEVVTFSLLSSFEEELKTAKRDAKFIEHTTGNAQKLLSVKDA